MGGDACGLILNCSTSLLRLSLTLRAQVTATIPKQREVILSIAQMTVMMYATLTTVSTSSLCPGMLTAV